MFSHSVFQILKPDVPHLFLTLEKFIIESGFLLRCNRKYNTSSKPTQLRCIFDKTYSCYKQEIIMQEFSNHFNFSTEYSTSCWKNAKPPGAKN